GFFRKCSPVARSTCHTLGSAAITPCVSRSGTSTLPKPTFCGLWSWSRQPEKPPASLIAAGTKNAARYINWTYILAHPPTSPQPHPPLILIDRSGRSLMKTILNRIAAALSIGIAAASPLAAQNAASNCDPTANTKGDIARAQFSMTRAISAADKGNPTRDLQEVLKLVDNGNDNPT